MRRNALTVSFLATAALLAGCSYTGLNEGTAYEYSEATDPDDIVLSGMSTTFEEQDMNIENFDSFTVDQQQGLIGVINYDRDLFVSDRTYKIRMFYEPDQYNNLAPVSFFNLQLEDFGSLVEELRMPILPRLDGAGIYNRLFGTDKTYQTIVPGELLKNGMTTANWVTDAMLTSAVYLDQDGATRSALFDGNGSYIGLDSDELTEYIANNTDEVSARIDNWANCMVSGGEAPAVKYGTIQRTEALRDTSSWKDSAYAERLTESIYEFGIGSGAITPFSATAVTLKSHFLREECPDKMGNQDPANYSGVIIAPTTAFTGMCADGAPVFGEPEEEFSLNFTVSSEGDITVVDEDAIALTPDVFLVDDTGTQGTVSRAGTLHAVRYFTLGLVGSPETVLSVANTITGVVSAGDNGLVNFSGVIISRQIQVDDINDSPLSIGSDCFSLAMTQTAGFNDKIQY